MVPVVALTSMELFFVFGFLALVVIGLAGAAWYEKKRRETLRRTASELGLEFAPKPNDLLRAPLTRLALFNKGRGCRAKNALSGQIEDIRVAIFDYRCTTGSGKNSSTHRQTVAAFEIPQSAFPAFEMRPEHIFHKIGNVFGYRDIDFDDYPSFSARYHLRGENEEAIRALFGAEVIEFFSGRNKLWIEARGSVVIIYRAGRRVKPGEISALLADSFDIATRLANREVVR